MVAVAHNVETKQLWSGTFNASDRDVSVPHGAMNDAGTVA